LSQCLPAAISTGGNVRIRVAPEVPAQFPDELRLLGQAVHGLGLRARALDRIQTVARTIADREGRNEVGLDEVSETIG